MNNNLFYITDEVLTENNAPSLHVIEVCNNLKKIGYKVTLLAPSLSTYQTDQFEIKKILMTNYVRSILFHPLLVISLFYYFIVGKISIVYIRYFPLLILPLLLSKLCNIPTVIEVNGKLVEETREANMSLLSFFYRVLEFVNMRLPSKIITVTEGLREYLIKTYNIKKDKIIVVQNGVALDQTNPVARDIAVKKAGLEVNKRYIGYVGSFYSYQGIQYMIKSIKAVVSKFPNTELVIVGNGPETGRVKIEKLVKKLELNNVVKIIGPVKHTDALNYINAFDICLCYPTTFRSNATSPFKLFEYLAYNKAIICSDIEGMKKSFKDNVYYVKANDAQSLTKAILNLLSNPKIKRKFEKNGRSFIEENYTWIHTVKKINNVLFQLNK